MLAEADEDLRESLESGALSIDGAYREMLRRKGNDDSAGSERDAVPVGEPESPGTDPAVDEETAGMNVAPNPFAVDDGWDVAPRRTADEPAGPNDGSGATAAGVHEDEPAEIGSSTDEGKERHEGNVEDEEHDEAEEADEAPDEVWEQLDTLGSALRERVHQAAYADYRRTWTWCKSMAKSLGRLLNRIRTGQD